MFVPPGFDVIMLPMIYGMNISETVEVLAASWLAGGEGVMCASPAAVWRLRCMSTPAQIEWVCTIFWSVAASTPRLQCNDLQKLLLMHTQPQVSGFKGESVTSQCEG